MPFNVSGVTIADVDAMKEHYHFFGIPITADGKSNAKLAGVVTNRDFGGTAEAPGEYFSEQGVRLKRYRGMASLEAMEKGGGKRYFAEQAKVKVAQGGSGGGVDKGSLFDYVPYLLQGLRHSFQDIGARDLLTLHEMLHNETLRFETRSLSAQIEGGVHDTYSYKEPKYM